MSVIVSHAVKNLAVALSEETQDHVRAAAAWALGQVGRHSPEHSKAVAVALVLPKLLHAYLDENNSDDLKLKSKKSTPKHPSKMHISQRIRALTPRRSARHFKTRHRSIFQSLTSRS